MDGDSAGLERFFGNHRTLYPKRARSFEPGFDDEDGVESLSGRSTQGGLGFRGESPTDGELQSLVGLLGEEGEFWKGASSFHLYWTQTFLVEQGETIDSVFHVLAEVFGHRPMPVIRGESGRDDPMIRGHPAKFWAWMVKRVREDATICARRQAEAMEALSVHANRQKLVKIVKPIVLSIEQACFWLGQQALGSLRWLEGLGSPVDPSKSADVMLMQLAAHVASVYGLSRDYSGSLCLSKVDPATGRKLPVKMPLGIADDASLMGREDLCRLSMRLRYVYADIAMNEYLGFVVEKYASFDSILLAKLRSVQSMVAQKLCNQKDSIGGDFPVLQVVSNTVLFRNGLMTFDVDRETRTPSYTLTYAGTPQYEQGCEDLLSRNAFARLYMDCDLPDSTVIDRVRRNMGIEESRHHVNRYARMLNEWKVATNEPALSTFVDSLCRLNEFDELTTLMLYVVIGLQSLYSAHHLARPLQEAFVLLPWFFGPGGTGKSFLGQVIASFRAENDALEIGPGKQADFATSGLEPFTQFVHMDEVSAEGLRSFTMERLNKIAEGGAVDITRKFKTNFDGIRTNFWMLVCTNHEATLGLSREDGNSMYSRRCIGFHFKHLVAGEDSGSFNVKRSMDQRGALAIKSLIAIDIYRRYFASNSVFAFNVSSNQWRMQARLLCTANPVRYWLTRHAITHPRVYTAVKDCMAFFQEFAKQNDLRGVKDVSDFAKMLEGTIDSLIVVKSRDHEHSEGVQGRVIQEIYAANSLKGHDLLRSLDIDSVCVFKPCIKAFPHDLAMPPMTDYDFDLVDQEEDFLENLRDSAYGIHGAQPKVEYSSDHLYLLGIGFDEILKMCASQKLVDTNGADAGMFETRCRANCASADSLRAHVEKKYVVDTLRRKYDLEAANLYNSPILTLSDSILKRKHRDPVTQWVTSCRDLRFHPELFTPIERVLARYAQDTKSMPHAAKYATRTSFIAQLERTLREFLMVVKCRVIDEAATSAETNGMTGLSFVDETEALASGRADCFMGYVTQTTERLQYPPTTLADGQTLDGSMKLVTALRRECSGAPETTLRCDPAGMHIYVVGMCLVEDIEQKVMGEENAFSRYILSSSASFSCLRHSERRIALLEWLRERVSREVAAEDAAAERDAADLVEQELHVDRAGQFVDTCGDEDRSVIAQTPETIGGMSTEDFGVFSPIESSSSDDDSDESL